MNFERKRKRKILCIYSINGNPRQYNIADLELSIVQSNPDIRMPFGDSKIKDMVRYPYIENDVNKALFC
jgi:hypothetical protein